MGPAWLPQTGTQAGTKVQTQRERQHWGRNREPRGWTGLGETHPIGHPELGNLPDQGLHVKAMGPLWVWVLTDISMW